MSSRDEFTFRIRDALEEDAATNEAAEDEPVTGRTPLAQLRWLAQHAGSEAARVQASKILLERADAEKRRRREEDSPDEINVRALTRELLELDEDAVDTDLDAATASRVMLVARDPAARVRFERTWTALQAALRVVQRERPPLPSAATQHVEREPVAPPAETLEAFSVSPEDATVAERERVAAERDRELERLRLRTSTVDRASLGSDD